MWKAFLLLSVFVFVMPSGRCGGQETESSRGPAPKTQGVPSAPLNLSDVLQSAAELRQAAESLERFGESMVKVSTVAERSAVTTSQNLAAIGGEFDPFGFKTAFLTIQQQNTIIQAQHEMIIKLQQQEIQRLRQQVKQQQAKQKSGQTSSKPSAKKKG